MKTLISTLLLTLLSCSASAQEDDNVYFVREWLKLSVPSSTGGRTV